MPSEATETGSFVATVPKTGTGYGEISFPIPLAQSLVAGGEKIKIFSEFGVIIEGEPFPTGCSISFVNFAVVADPGFMCVMVNDVDGLEKSKIAIKSPIDLTGALGPEPPIASGAIVEVTGTEGQFALGTWAVTAP